MKVLLTRGLESVIGENPAPISKIVKTMAFCAIPYWGDKTLEQIKKCEDAPPAEFLINSIYVLKYGLYAHWIYKKLEHFL